MKKLIAGMDLHSNNVVIGLVDMDGKRVAHQKVECKLSQVLKFLAPYKKRLEQIGVAEMSEQIDVVPAVGGQRLLEDKLQHGAGLSHIGKRAGSAGPKHLQFALQLLAQLLPGRG